MLNFSQKCVIYYVNKKIQGEKRMSNDEGHCADETTESKPLLVIVNEGTSPGQVKFSIYILVSSIEREIRL